MKFASLRSLFFAVFFAVAQLTFQSHASIEIANHECVSPTHRFTEAVPYEIIKMVLESYGAQEDHLALFDKIADQERCGFIGYHGGCNRYRIFQDIIRITIEEILNIPIRNDFHFLRVPGLPEYDLESAGDFLIQSVPVEPNGFDCQPKNMAQILSLNISLYQSYNKPWDLTPRYYLENSAWNDVDFKDKLIPFFTRFGISTDQINPLYIAANAYLTRPEGILLQFFDETHYQLLDRLAYACRSGGIPNGFDLPSEYFFNDTIRNFPQLRLIMNNRDTLNPNSELIIKRYTLMLPEHEEVYENVLRKKIRALKYDAKKAEQYKSSLLSLWE